MDQILLSPLYQNLRVFDTGMICNECSSLLLSRGGGGGGRGDLSPMQVGPGYSLGNYEDLNFKIPKRGQKTIVAIHFFVV